MANLTTIDGLQVHFDPAAVTAMADHDVDTGQAATMVYGLSAGAYRIAETVDGFLTRIGVIKTFAELTRTNGTPIWVNAKAVATVRPPLPGEYAPGAASVVTVGSLTQAVTEAPAAVVQAVNAHGGQL